VGGNWVFNVNIRAAQALTIFSWSGNCRSGCSHAAGFGAPANRHVAGLERRVGEGGLPVRGCWRNRGATSREPLTRWAFRLTIFEPWFESRPR
jgi:hypothetical protein